jgi:hypothetical protein
MNKQDQIVELRNRIIALKLSNPYDKSIPKLNQQLDQLTYDQPEPTS